ncbi:MAG: mechanosensitive ion channel family protein [Patescibacteria group bacterium]|nr:mechanosensitive ion channel family protein [Patescibacteria group bacterium]
MQDKIITFLTSQNGFWGQMFLGNTLRMYVTALIILIISILFFLLVQKIILVKLESFSKKTKNDLDDALIATVKHIKPPFYWFLSFYIALRLLNYPDNIRWLLDSALIIILVIQVLTASSTFINFVFKKLASGQKESSSKSAMGYLAIITKIVVWSLGILLILSNLGLDITSLIAGLGIGGIAIAFALQNILADLFSSFAIWFDKPFVVGDFIVVGEHSGNVEKIGIKTTRIRSLQGEEIIISNQELTTARIQNFKRLKERRAVFNLGVEYSTDPKLLKDIPMTIQNIVKDISQARFDRAHFAKFGDSALIYEIVYFIESEEYDVYMDVQQAINLAIHETFRDKGISIAFPTQTIHLVK